MMTEPAAQYQVPEVDDLLEAAIELVANARPMPMSSTVKVNRDELLDLLEDARDNLPDELRRARWLLKEKEDFLDEARAEREEIIEQGRTQVAHLVGRQEIVKAAEARARQIVSEAKADARNLQRQVEDYCDQKLASFEIVLERTARTIQDGREKLLGTAGPEDEEYAEVAPADDAEAWSDFEEKD